MKPFRLEKRYDGIGTVRVMTDLTDPSEITEFKGLMEGLARARPRLVMLFRDKQLSARDLLRAAREERLGALLPDERLLVPMDAALTAAWNRARRTGPKTLLRYKVSMKKLRAAAGLDRVLDLRDVPWEEIAATWEGSPSDWMHCYRAVSRFLTLHLGGGRTGRFHPFRHEVMDLLPRKKERKRVPTISPATFLRLVTLAPEHLRPCYMTLVITGLRVGEYLALERSHLRPDTFEIEIPGTKTDDSEAVLPVRLSTWTWIDQAVPSPVRYRRLWEAWKQTCAKEGLSGVWLHDLRHCHGQWCSNEKVPEAMVQAYLRHSDPETTRRYTMQQLRQEPAAAIARVLGLEVAV